MADGRRGVGAGGVMEAYALHAQVAAHGLGQRRRLRRYRQHRAFVQQVVDAGHAAGRALHFRPDLGQRAHRARADERIEHELAQRFTSGAPAGILTFGIHGGIEAGARFIDALQLVVRLVNIGDAKSLACHPASTTHRQLNEEELAKAGVSQDMIRLSIGIEHIDDILADLSQALDAAKG